MLPPTPPQDDLLKLAEAALSNAADLLADARLLAGAGRFPRAHALATLACEELGKSRQCLSNIWLPRPPKAFWEAFTSHAGKLSHVQADAVLDSGAPARSPRAFRLHVSQVTRAAHQRKLRGLYVGYADGKPELPGEITGAEAWQLIDQAQRMLDRDTTSQAERVTQVQWLSRQPEAVRVFWLTFLAWVATSETGTLMALIREGGPPEVTTTDLLHRFLRHVEASGGRLPDPFAHEWLRTPDIYPYRRRDEGAAGRSAGGGCGRAGGDRTSCTSSASSAAMRSSRASTCTCRSCSAWWPGVTTCASSSGMPGGPGPSSVMTIISAGGPGRGNEDISCPRGRARD